MKTLLNGILLICGLCYIGISQANADKKKEIITTPSTVIYALPKTVIDVEAVVEKTILKRGPFADYAEKYIGIQDVVSSDEEEWEMKEIKISDHHEVDAQQFYKIINTGNYEPNLISLTPEGLISGFNIESQEINEIEEDEKNIIYNEKDVKIEYGSFAINPNTKIKTDTIYKIVKTDTTLIKMPILSAQTVTKTIEEKAKEAAHHIFKLRKRRFKILTSNFEVLPPDGKSYKIIVEELERLEKQYLSLFVGEKIKVAQKHYFSYTPKDREKTNVLFRFSQEKGVLNSKDLTGFPIKVELEDLQITKEVKLMPTNEEIKTDSKIYYRIPGQAKIKVTNNKKVLSQKNMTIAQFGKIAHMPVEVLVNEGYSMQFYHEYGSIKNIYKSDQ